MHFTVFAGEEGAAFARLAVPISKYTPRSRVALSSFDLKQLFDLKCLNPPHMLY
jgi:hypothetical protein